MSEERIIHRIISKAGIGIVDTSGQLKYTNMTPEMRAFLRGKRKAYREIMEVIENGNKEES